MRPGSVTVKFVEDRREALRQQWGQRNRRMDEMEKLYRMQVWKGKAPEGEYRVSSPRACTTVESFRTLLLTQHPVISVPASEVRGVAQERAEQLEKYLYGTWARMAMMAVLDDAEWYADCLGLGIVRLLYDDRAAEGEFPLFAQALDPRNCYPVWDPRRPLEPVEVVHSYKRRRRDIEVEWGVKLTPGKGVGDLEEWRDEKADYTEYWRVDLVEEKDKAEEAEGQAAEGEEPEHRGMMRRVVDRLQARGKGKRTARAVWKRRTLHCVVVDGQWVKKPTWVPGYERLPFYCWAGVRTPLASEDGTLSVLFPLAGGAKETDDVLGILGAEHLLLGMKMAIVSKFANGAAWTDDQELEQLSWNPRALNRVKPGAKIGLLMPPSPTPAVDQLMAQLQALGDDASLPPAMRGQYVGDVSGLYLSAITNPVLMKVAARQRDREAACAAINAGILALTEEYAPPEGWLVYGADKGGQDFELQLGPDQIGGYRRTRVKLSASLPKDSAGEIMSLAALVRDRLLSRRTAMDQIQEIRRMAGVSPEDEQRQILTETILAMPEIQQGLAIQALREYDPALADELLGAAGAEAEPGTEGLEAGGAPGPEGPMMGLPPSVLPPGAVPEAVGGQDLGAMAALLGGEPMPWGPGPGPVEE
jgi:hypothetical protein